MRTREAASYCGLAHRTLEKLRLTGEGPAYLKIGRAVVYDRHDLDQWLAAKRRRSTSEQS
jgi:predicted DNA-binding transcriptional regulator AlpA